MRSNVIFKNIDLFHEVALRVKIHTRDKNYFAQHLVMLCMTCQQMEEDDKAREILTWFKSELDHMDKIPDKDKTDCELSYINCLVMVKSNNFEKSYPTDQNELADLDRFTA